MPSSVSEGLLANASGPGPGCKRALRSRSTHAACVAGRHAWRSHVHVRGGERKSLRPSWWLSVPSRLIFVSSINFFFSCLRLFFLSQTVMEVFLTQDSLPPLPRPERQAKVFKDTRSSPNTVLRGGTSVCAPTFALAFSAHMGCLRLSILACGLAPLAGSKSTAVWAPSAHVASGRPRCSCRGELGWPHVD